MSNIKANRTFTFWRKYGWLLTIIIAFGGLYEHKLGLIVPFFVIPGMMITSLFDGRFWCGNVCPHGSLYDSVMLKNSKNEDIPEIFRKKRASVVTVFVFLYNKFIRKSSKNENSSKLSVREVFAIIAYILFIIVLGVIVVGQFRGFSRISLLEKIGLIFSVVYLVVVLISVPLALFIVPRTWCQFCPMGKVQKLLGKLGQSTNLSKNTNAKLTIIDKDQCIKCKKCAKVCPMQLEPYLNFNENNQFDDINCIKCNTCVNNCPKKILIIKKSVQN